MAVWRLCDYRQGIIEGMKLMVGFAVNEVHCRRMAQKGGLKGGLCDHSSVACYGRDSVCGLPSLRTENAVKW